MEIKGNDISAYSRKSESMLHSTRLIRTALAGTKAIRLEGYEFLPKYSAETETDYKSRLKRAVFTNYLSLTVKHLVGKTFAKPLVLQEDVPPQIVEWAEDIDLQGTHLNDFASRLFAEVLSIGFTSVLVDYPKLEGITSLADERERGGRPYFRMVNQEDLLGVRSGALGTRVQQARIREVVEEPDGLYGEKMLSRVRLLFPGGYELYQQLEKENSKGQKEYVLIDAGKMNPLQTVPLIPIYGYKVESWRGEPVLLDLLYKNIQYFQVDSDLDNALRVASFPMLAVSGWDQDRDPTITVGPNVVLATENPSGRFYYVEHSGTAIGVGRQRLEDLKADMATMGLQMMMPRASGDATATETQVKYAESTSDLQRMAFGLKDALENSLQSMAEWVGLKSGGSIELRGQFTLPRDAVTEVQALISLRATREITSATLLNELKRRDFLPDDFDVEGERELLAIEDEPFMGGDNFDTKKPTDETEEKEETPTENKKE